MHKIQFEYLSFFLNWYVTKIKVIYVVFVTCHINFWPLSNFVGASLEVTRTISNNKLHFTFFVIKKKEKGPETGFLWWFWHIFKYFNSNHNLPSYLLFSKCFSWLFYLGVHRGTGVFSWFYFSLLLSRVTRSRARLALVSVWPKNAEKLRLLWSMISSLVSSKKRKKNTDSNLIRADRSIPR